MGTTKGKINNFDFFPLLLLRLFVKSFTFATCVCTCGYHTQNTLRHESMNVHAHFTVRSFVRTVFFLCCILRTERKTIGIFRRSGFHLKCSNGYVSYGSQHGCVPYTYIVSRLIYECCVSFTPFSTSLFGRTQIYLINCMRQQALYFIYHSFGKRFRASILYLNCSLFISAFVDIQVLVVGVISSFSNFFLSQWNRT